MRKVGSNLRVHEADDDDDKDKDKSASCGNKDSGARRASRDSACYESVPLAPDFHCNACSRPTPNRR